MTARIFRRFFWSAFILFAGTLLLLNVYVTSFAGKEHLVFPLLAASLISTSLAVVMGLTFMRSFSRRIERLRTYVEGLLDARLPDSELPAGDDELGALALSLRRAAPQIRDLVERLKVEGAQREAILASMVEGVLAVDKDMRVTFCNDSFARTVAARIRMQAIR